MNVWDWGTVGITAPTAMLAPTGVPTQTNDVPDWYSTLTSVSSCAHSVHVRKAPGLYTLTVVRQALGGLGGGELGGGGLGRFGGCGDGGGGGGAGGGAQVN